MNYKSLEQNLYGLLLYNLFQQFVQQEIKKKYVIHIFFIFRLGDTFGSLIVLLLYYFFSSLQQEINQNHVIHVILNIKIGRHIRKF